MRILHLITGLRPHGAETMLAKIVKEHAAAGITSHVISLDADSTLAPTMTRAGATVSICGATGTLTAFRALTLVKSLIKQFKPDIVQGWMVHGNILATAAGLMIVKRLPVVWNIRMSLDALETQRLRTRLLIRTSAPLSRCADGIIFNSFASLKQHRAIGYHCGNAIVIGNGFDLSVFKPDENANAAVRAEYQVASGTTVLGHVARAHPMKDHAGLLRAAAHLVSKGYRVVFLLSGRGVDANNTDLVGLAKNLGIWSHIRLLGDRTDMPRITASFDIATNCSRGGEGFPNAIGEAMSCGVPCVATDVGDSKYIIGDTGLVVSPSDPVALSCAWERLLRDPPQRALLGVAARERISSEFSIAAISRQYVRLYSELQAQ